MWPSLILEKICSYCLLDELVAFEEIFPIPVRNYLAIELASKKSLARQLLIHEILLQTIEDYCDSRVSLYRCPCGYQYAYNNQEECWYVLECYQCYEINCCLNCQPAKFSANSIYKKWFCSRRCLKRFEKDKGPIEDEDFKIG